MSEVDPCFLAWVYLLERLEKGDEKKGNNGPEGRDLPLQDSEGS